ncbi:MAG: hypothetical protein RL511_147 [Bacteroidota bacterium]|jgi:hypothetical protein
MIWLVGQEVGVLREAGVFKVRSIDAEHLLLEDENGFTYRYLKHEVVVRQAIHTDKITAKDKLTKSSSAKQRTTSSHDKRIPSIDLHAEELLLPGQLSAHDVFLAQLRAFKQFCNQQAQARQAKFMVVHGAGEGRLKEALRQIVMARAGISMHDAQWSNGSVGASRVELVLSAFDPF